MSEPLTERQAEILKLIKELTEVSGFPPTRAEIADRMGFRSVNAAEQHLQIGRASCRERVSLVV